MESYELCQNKIALRRLNWSGQLSVSSASLFLQNSAPSDFCLLTKPALPAPWGGNSDLQKPKETVPKSSLSNNQEFCEPIVMNIDVIKNKTYALWLNEFS